MKKTLRILLISILAANSAHAQLDPSFGVGGKVQTNIGQANYTVNCQAMQADGKLIIAGIMTNGVGAKAFLARVNADGTSDTSFGGGRILNPYCYLYQSVKVQPDGKIIAAGTFDGENALARYLPDGTLDTSFDDDGLIYTEDSGNSSSIEDMVLQPDGKIVVVSYFPSTPAEDYRLTRYTADGYPDTTFDGDGSIQVNVNNSDHPTTVLLQPDGKILVGGYLFPPGTGDLQYFITRHNTNGSLDTTFNSTGKKTIAYTDSGVLHDIALQTDGKIVFNGRAGFPTTMVTGRINANGSVDTSFGTAGTTITTVNIDSQDNTGEIRIQADGKIVAINRLSYPADNSQDVLLMRYNANGTLDTSFSGDGMFNFAYYPGRNYGRDFDIVGGKYLISGNTEASFSDNQVALSRVNADGTLDTTYNTDGKAFINFTDEGYDAAHAVAIQSDGKILVAGEALANDFLGAVVRYNTNGSLDTTFGTDGKAILNQAGTIKAMVVQASGKIIVAGDDQISTFMVRLNADGSTDNTFDDTQLHDDFEEFGRSIEAMKILSTGKILVAGRSYNEIDGIYSANNYLARVNTNGSLDTTFGTDGYSYVGSTELADGLSCLKVLSDGKILAGGIRTYSNGAYDMTVTKYLVNGALDTSFINGGTFALGIPSSNARTVAIDTQSDGKIIVGFEALALNELAENTFGMLRLSANGNFDNAFGLVLTQVEGSARTATLQVLADQKILMTGTSTGDNENFAIVKYNSDGQKDMTFGTNGTIVTDFNATDDSISSAVATTDNKIVVCGSAYDINAQAYDFAVARYGTSGTLATNQWMAAASGFYPNPSKGKVIFTGDVQSVTVLTVDGRIVKSFNVIANEVNVSDFTSGIYLLRYTTKDGVTKTEKLLKQ